tara:strand:- start:1154 stop:1618 length:465 start_codon:yes stop_codon:yes gene_type:complete
MDYKIFMGLRVYRCGKVERLFWGKYWKVVENVANTSNGYNRVRVDGKMFLRHRLVVAAFNPAFDIDNPEQLVDHVDGNKLNNAFANLRVVTQQGNRFNNHIAKGYSWNKLRGKWKAQIKVDGKQKHLGLYETEEEARAAYLAAKEVLHVIEEIC